MAEKIYVGGVTNTVMHLENDGTIHVEDSQDSQGILDYAAAGRNNRFDADSCDGMLRHIAEVPMVKYQEWCREANVPLFSAAADIVLEAKLRDIDNARMLAAPKVRDPRIIMRGAR
jgi:hypothetical protein